MATPVKHMVAMVLGAVILCLTLNKTAIQQDLSWLEMSQWWNQVASPPSSIFSSPPHPPNLPHWATPHSTSIQASPTIASATSPETSPPRSPPLPLPQPGSNLTTQAAPPPPAPPSGRGGASSRRRGGGAGDRLGETLVGSLPMRAGGGWGEAVVSAEGRRRQLVVNGSVVGARWGECRGRGDEEGGEALMAKLLSNVSAMNGSESDDEKVLQWSSDEAIERAANVSEASKGTKDTPNILHFMWVSAHLGEWTDGACSVPRFAVKIMRLWEKMHVGWTVVLWTNRTVRMYLASVSDSLLKHLPVAAWVSDIARLGVLDQFGGLYVDVDTLPLKRWDSLVQEHSPFAICTRAFGGSLVVGEGRGTQCKMVANGVIASPAGSSIMSKTFRQVVVKSDTYGQRGRRAFDVKVAGPVVLTRVLRQHEPLRGEKNFTLLSHSFFFPCTLRERAACNPVEAARDGKLFSVHLNRGSWYTDKPKGQGGTKQSIQIVGQEAT